MDKYEYKVRAEEIKSLIAEGEFAEAVKIADTIDWKRVKSVMMLCTISDLYKINRRFQESKDILLMAYERHPGGRLIVYSLCELSIKMGEIVQAIEYYKEFVQIAPKDTGRYILQYKLYEAQDVSLEERIAVLEEFKKRDYREKWAYELAYLYHRVGLETKCVEECDEMILWFGEGRYIQKALELKQLHQPLTPMQQDKYDMLKAAHEQPEQYWEESPEESQERQDDMEEADSSDFSDREEEEEEFSVKTVDVGQYNTINLQKELAESMKELLDDESGKPGEKEEEESSMGPVTESIVAPLLQDTEELSKVRNIRTPFTAWPEDSAGEKDGQDKGTFEVQPPDGETEPEVKAQNEEPSLQKTVATSEKVKPMPQGAPVGIKHSETVLKPAAEEVFFEDMKDVLLEDTKEIPIEELEENLNDTKELNPKRRVIYPSKVSKPAASASVKAPSTAPVTVHANQLLKNKMPSGFEQMLSQEYDGQISLVVPDKSQVEKQITGQMNITDIMAEWERMKRENEEKRREDVRKRVQQHTGNMFSEFDEATKTGLLEQLEKAVVDAILKESGKHPINPEDITSSKVSDIVRSVEKEKKKESEEKTADIEEIAEAKKPERIAAEADILSLEETDLENEPVKEDNAANIKNMVESVNRLRDLSEEEKELFGKYIHNKRTKQQIIHAVDTVSMDSYTDNVIVTGEDGTGTLELSKGLIRMLQISDANFSGKVAKISGDTLNKKDVEATLAKLTDGALIIEHAAAMSEDTAVSLNRTLSKENCGLLVIMEDSKDAMNRFMDRNHILSENFNARIDVEALDNQALVEYARQYAEEMEYSIDELGILALHTRIADMQTSDHEVTVSEVRELVDDAIYFADKKNPKHFFDILFGKRYDEEDMIILREKDFMHY